MWNDFNFKKKGEFEQNNIKLSYETFHQMRITHLDTE